MNLGVTELLIVLAVVLLLFGSTRLPALARSFGQAKHEFERGEHEPLPPAPTPRAADSDPKDRRT
jgi:TatA/E family protein of Tat protein translocase